MTRRSKSYTIIIGELYRRSPTKILQSFIPIDQGKRLLWDIHSRVCGHHTASKTLVEDTFRQGFYWPTVVKDAAQIVHSHKGCQFYARLTHLSTQALQTIPLTCCLRSGA